MAEETPKKNNEMSAAESAAFFAMADQFLAVANNAIPDEKASAVSAAMMYATARFNAFVAQTQGLPAGEVDEDAVVYFRDEYEKMLRENLAQTLINRN
ncbi:MAG: DUF3144 domain-containing protein [Pseudomonadota bacterium]